MFYALSAEKKIAKVYLLDVEIRKGDAGVFSLQVLFFYRYEFEISQRNRL